MKTKENNEMVKHYARSLLQEDVMPEGGAISDDSVIPRKMDYEIDNRDITTVWLRLSDGKYIEVDPWELLQKAIESAGLSNEEDVLAQLETTRQFADEIY